MWASHACLRGAAQSWLWPASVCPGAKLVTSWSSAAQAWAAGNGGKQEGEEAAGGLVLKAPFRGNESSEARSKAVVRPGPRPLEAALPSVAKQAQDPEQKDEKEIEEKDEKDEAMPPTEEWKARLGANNLELCAGGSCMATGSRCEATGPTPGSAGPLQRVRDINRTSTKERRLPAVRSHDHRRQLGQWLPYRGSGLRH